MARPVPTPLYHFTHIDHLPTILECGLLSDNSAQSAGLVQAEVGDLGIKAWRRLRPVTVPPLGVVADYVPFYFAPRSPMMFKIHKGGVPSYAKGCDDLIYLVTTVERLAGASLPLVFSDRNAALSLAAFTSDVGEMEGLVDWELMKARMWNNTRDEPDRMERRMAECLVYGHVPWTAFESVVAKTSACARAASEILATVGEETPVRVAPYWYF